MAARLGFEIHDILLFDRALTHASMAAEVAGPMHDYESLEFLGDAVLGLAVAHYLYEVLPDRSPGEYSRLRAGLVNRRAVARVARELDIAPAIQLGKGEEMSGGRQRTALVSDCLESLIGALYLDSGWEVARAFVVRVFSDEFERSLKSGQVWDYKSRLQNYCQGKRLGLPRFELVRSEGPDHKKEFEVQVLIQDKPLGCGRGSTKKEAEQHAAREALHHEGQDIN